MLPLSALWLPILLSAVFVFIASSILHMVIPIHKSDFKKLPGEEQILEAMRNQNVQPGLYMFPRGESMKDMCSPEMVEKCNRGPVGHLIVMPNGPFSMGKSLVQWFIYSVLISVMVAYVAMLGLERGAEYMLVFRMTGTAAILAYAIGEISDSIWKGRSWSITLKFVFDGIVYGLVTAGTFGWLWPESA